MGNSNKTKAPLHEECVALRQQVNELKQQKVFQTDLLNAVGQAIIATNLQGEIIFFNHFAEQLYGWTVDEALGQNVIEITVPRISQQQAEEILTSLKEGNSWRGEFYVQRKDGTIFPAMVIDTPILNVAGELIGIIGVSVDITQQKAAESQLEKTRWIQEEAERLAHVGSWDWNIVTNEVYWSKGLYRIYGRTPDEGPPPLEHYMENIHPDDQDPLQNAIEAAIAGKKSYSIAFRLFRYNDGEERYLQATGEIFKNEDGKPERLVGAVQDITHLKQMEQEIIHLERLRAAGELSAGISHNLNNILTGVISPAQLLRQEIDDPELLLDVDTILTSAIRARDLVQDLHHSVRAQEEETLQHVAINHIVQQAIQTSRPRWKDPFEALGVSIEMHIETKAVQPIKGTETGLHAILTNLILNAVDVMPEGGKITIETRDKENEVQLIFSDTGHGMNEETKRRIYEPFFTTKMDIGTGLGLSTVYNTVTRWGGQIAVDSSLDKGTTFTLNFPAWTEAVSKTEQAPTQKTRSGKILIVDDDETICRLLSRLLRTQHTVETMTSAQQALDAFAPEKYDVAMIDLGMSEMSGVQFLNHIKKIDPVISTVLITGWILSDTDSRVRSFDFKITKPFSDINKVEAVIAQAIEHRHERKKKEHR